MNIIYYDLFVFNNIIGKKGFDKISMKPIKIIEEKIHP